MAEVHRFEAGAVFEVGKDMTGALSRVLRERHQCVELSRRLDPAAHGGAVAAAPAVDGPHVVSPPEKHGGHRGEQQIAARAEPGLEPFEPPERGAGAGQPVTQFGEPRGLEVFIGERLRNLFQARDLRLHQRPDRFVGSHPGAEPHAERRRRPQRHEEERHRASAWNPDAQLQNQGGAQRQGGDSDQGLEPPARGRRRRRLRTGALLLPGFALRRRRPRAVSKPVEEHTGPGARPLAQAAGGGERFPDLDP